jgi:hypothetical protein
VKRRKRYEIQVKNKDKKNKVRSKQKKDERKKRELFLRNKRREDIAVCGVSAA